MKQLIKIEADDSQEPVVANVIIITEWGDLDKIKYGDYELEDIREKIEELLEVLNLNASGVTLEVVDN